MSLTIQAVVEGEVLQSRKVDSKKDGKKEKYYHRMLVLDGFGVKQTVDVGSNKGERKVGPAKVNVAISLDRDKSGAVAGLRLWEV